jgi:hypothetical protein
MQLRAMSGRPNFRKAQPADEGIGLRHQQVTAVGDRATVGAVPSLGASDLRRSAGAGRRETR